MDSLQALQAFI